MMPIGEALIGAGTGLVGGLLGFSGQQKANEQNIALAREQMKFQGAQTAAQMAFQERMSNSVHQREVADLKAAGLNPLLALKSGGAPAPSGASASGAMTSVQSPMDKAVSASSALTNSALSTAKLMSEIKLLEKQAYAAEASGTKSAADAQFLVNEQRARYTAETEGVELRNARDRIENRLYENWRRGQLEQLSLGNARTALDSQLLRYELPLARNMAELHDSAVGRKMLPWLSSATALSRLLGGVVGAIPRTTVTETARTFGRGFSNTTTTRR